MPVTLTIRLHLPLMLAFLVFGLLQAGCSSDQEEQFVDVTGTPHSPLHGSEGDLVVIIFSSTDCPIANAMAPELERAHQEAVGQGGRFYLVHARRDLQDATAVKHASEYSLSMPVLIDHDHALVEHFDAKVTPEAFVLQFTGPDEYEIAYTGSINNLYGSVGNRRTKATEHYLREAITSISTGNNIEVKERQPFGCFIEREQ